MNVASARGNGGYADLPQHPGALAQQAMTTLPLLTPIYAGHWAVPSGGD